jgi:predicted glycosyl hydrolase (DUF1957 family)
MIAFLLDHPAIHVTLNISGSLTQLLVTHGYTDIISGIRTLAEREQIELVNTACYHCILPLLPTEADRQITLNTTVNQKAFGSIFAPAGFFPPEMAYSPELDDLLIKKNIRWIILDEISETGRLGSLRTNIRYYTPRHLFVVYRDRAISNFLSFTAPLDNDEEAWQSLQQATRSQTYCVTAMDGENLGHHRKGADRLWQALIQRPEVETFTISSYLNGLTTERLTNPQASSWSTEEYDLEHATPFGLWQSSENMIHTEQWRLIHAVMRCVQEAEKKKSPGSEEAHTRLDAALASDQLWWASAQPWWSVEMIIEGAQALRHVIEPLHFTGEGEREINDLADTIARYAQAWQNDGTADQRRKAFAARSHVKPFMGGREVI